MLSKLFCLATWPSFKEWLNRKHHFVNLLRNNKQSTSLRQYYGVIDGKSVSSNCYNLGHFA